jgi:hypothetical protein
LGGAQPPELLNQGTVDARLDGLKHSADGHRLERVGIRGAAKEGNRGVIEGAHGHAPRNHGQRICTICAQVLASPGSTSKTSLSISTTHAFHIESVCGVVLQSIVQTAA